MILLWCSLAAGALALYSLPAALNRWNVPGKHGVAWACVAGCSIAAQGLTTMLWLTLGSPT